jgi:hypothetical protein
LSYACGKTMASLGCDHRFVPDRGKFRFIILEC